MSKVIPTEERIAKARKLIEKARGLQRPDRPSRQRRCLTVASCLELDPIVGLGPLSEVQSACLGRPRPRVDRELPHELSEPSVEPQHAAGAAPGAPDDPRSRAEGRTVRMGPEAGPASIDHDES